MTEVPVVIGRVDRLMDIVFKFDAVVVVAVIVCGRMSKRKVRTLQRKVWIWSLMELSLPLLVK